MPETDWTFFISEHLPLIIAVVTAALVVVVLTLRGLLATAHLIGYRKGYRAGRTDEREILVEEAEVTYPHIVETRPDGTKVRVA